jgi:small GTP-binding protein
MAQKAPMPAIEILHDRLPTVAIVGRPNVGKSTLFNRMVGRRKAVVLDEPGMTRDRNFEVTEWRDRNFALVDTGGYETDAGSDIVRQMRVQSLIAMREADVIVFLTNVRDQIHPDDEDVANLLRRTRKPVLIAVNKCDNPRYCQEAMTFYALGFEDLFTISALNGDGTGDLLDRIVEVLPPTEEDARPEKGIRIAVIGKPNAGKSSLINAILGEDRVIVSDVAGTTRDSIDTTFRIKPPKAGQSEEEPLDENDEEIEIIHCELDKIEETEVDDEKGWYDEDESEAEEETAEENEIDETEPAVAEETEDAEDVPDGDEKYGIYVFQREIDEVERKVDAAQRERSNAEQSERPNTGIYTLVDTAGLRRRGKIQRGIERLSTFSAQASLRRSDVALIVVDASQGLTEQDAHVAGFAHEEKRACILLINKWDLLDKDNSTHSAFVKKIRYDMGFLNYAPILMISAKTKQRVHQVLPLVDHVYEEFNKWIDTPTLNKWLDETVRMQSPPWRKGHQLRIKYATQVAVRPPTFIFFVNNPHLVHFSYQRYLQNRLREAFGFEGCPIRIKFRAKGKRVDEEMEDVGTE